MIYIIINLILVTIAFIFLGMQLQKGLKQEKEYKRREVHDDMFFAYIETTPSEDVSEEDYLVFKRNWYTNITKQQAYFK
jgi:hypothetical protein